MSNAASARKATQTARLKRNEEKWTKPLWDAGWTAIPSILLERQNELQLDAVDVNIVLHLASHWWYSNNLPHPSKAKMARCIGVNVSTIRRHVARLETLGYIRRESRYSKNLGQDTNLYHFEGLISAATPHALEEIQKKKKRAADKAAKQNLEKPKLKLVQSAGGKNADVR